MSKLRTLAYLDFGTGEGMTSYLRIERAYDEEEVAKTFFLRDFRLLIYVNPKGVQVCEGVPAETRENLPPRILKLVDAIENGESDVPGGFHYDIVLHENYS